jgi:hypothetical protein
MGLEIRDDPGMIRRQSFTGGGNRQLHIRIGHSGIGGTAAGDLGEIAVHLSLFFHFVGFEVRFQALKRNAAPERCFHRSNAAIII